MKSTGAFLNLLISFEYAFSSNIFDLIEAIIKKDKKRSLTIYNDIVNYGEEVFKIMISLANQIRLLLQVKILEKENDTDIAEQLHLKNPKQLYC